MSATLSARLVDEAAGLGPACPYVEVLARSNELARFALRADRMVPSLSFVRRSPPRFLLWSAAVVWLACAPTPASITPPLAPPAPAPTLAAPLAAPDAGGRAGRVLLAAPHEESLGFVLEPVPGGRSAIAVAQLAGDRAAWVRRIDGTSGAFGPLVRFLDQHILGAFDRADGSPTFVTSDGARVCVGPSARPDERTCVQSNASAVVQIGDRVALLEVVPVRPPEGASHAPRAAPKETKPSHRAKGSHKKKAAHAASPRKPSHPIVELFVRWLALGPPPQDASAPADSDAKPTGLRFEAPLDGMTLVDARARAPGIDLLWFETAPNRKSRAPLGSGRLMAGSLRADGSLDPASRVAVLDADLEYGQLKDHHAPRLVGSGAVSTYLGLDAKGQCEAIRVRPTLAHLGASSAACAVAPDRVAETLEPAEIAAFERIFADDPRRAFGQPKADAGRVAWAGDRAYYLHAGALRSGSRADGTARDEPAPFTAKRARIAWGAFAADGEGVAFVDGGLVHVDAGAPVEPRRTAVPEGVKPGLVGARELSPDRRRAARIGATWWIARGQRLRVWPDVVAPATPADASAAHHHPDTSVLVGGQERGLLLALANSALRLVAVDAQGAATTLPAIAPAPVRAGFDACERAAGGALVAGVSAADPTKVVVIVVDAAGHAGDLHPIAIPIRAGDLGVRVMPLPAGGALVTDLDRRHVVWIDDDARPLADAPWPIDASDAVCLDGRPMRLAIPTATPARFVQVPDVASGACIVGDPTWSRDGSLHWFGGTSDGLDFSPEAAAIPIAPPANPTPTANLAPTADASPPASPAPTTNLAPTANLAPNAAPAPAPAAPAHTCPSEMVSIAGRFCVDRFEAALLDARTAEPLSPDYPVTPGLLDFALGEWSTARERTGNVHARAFPLPWIAPSRVGDKPEPVAVARLGVRPSGYVTGLIAEAACAAAGKRLCTLDEFVMACRGEDDTLFPYGDTYEDGVCNVFRDDHPAAMLHGNSSIGHLDPRLNRVSSRGRPLLQRTGESPACRSRWGDDAVYDMVGNLDEWVDEGNGAFAGGFYARSTRSGCEAIVAVHPKSYLDYSTGVRCCRNSD